MKRQKVDSPKTYDKDARQTQVCDALLACKELITGKENAKTIEELADLLERTGVVEDSYVKGNYPIIRNAFPILRRNGWGFYSCRNGIFYSNLREDRDEFVRDQLKRASGLHQSAREALNIPAR
jgi:hypothetical protein